MLSVYNSRWWWYLMGEDFLSPAPLRSSGHSAMPYNNWNHFGGIPSGCSRLEHIWNYQKTVTGTIITWPSHSCSTQPVLLGLSAKTWAIAELFILAWDYIHSLVFNSSNLVGGWDLLCPTGFYRMLFIVLLRIQLQLSRLYFQGSSQPAAKPCQPRRAQCPVEHYSMISVCTEGHPEKSFSH